MQAMYSSSNSAEPVPAETVLTANDPLYCAGRISNSLKAASNSLDRQKFHHIATASAEPSIPTSCKVNWAHGF